MALTFETSTNHHLVLASEMDLRIVWHLIHIPDIILTREITARLSREGGRDIATELNAFIPILFTMSKGAHRINYAILQKAQNGLNTSMSVSSFFYISRQQTLCVHFVC